MICGCPAFKVEFDTAVSKEACGNVRLAGLEQMRHPHATKTG